MAQGVARAISSRRHLVVQAGTGTGKSLAYLVPALALGARVVVSTATKALQDQLAQRDLPMLGGSLGIRFEFAVLKGRSNYICRQRAREISGAGEQMSLDDEVAGRSPALPGSHLGRLGREVRDLVLWAGEKVPGVPPLRRATSTGDRAELSWEPSDAAWAQVSTGWRECPGAAQCPSGGDCFAELARRRASEADVVVVNTHLYATALALKDADILPPHDLVVFDEAHELEDIASSALGFELSPGRVSSVARLSRSAGADSSATAALEEAATLFAATLRNYRGRALPRPLDEQLGQALTLLRGRASRVAEELRKAGRAGTLPGTGAEPGAGLGEVGSTGDSATRQRAQKAVTGLVEELNDLTELPPGEVAWVEGPDGSPVVKVAPIDVGAALTESLWKGEGAPTAVLTSATIPPGLGERLGLSPDGFEELSVGSPFAYEEQALLYCPLHLPDPRSPGFEAAMLDELEALLQASEGRAMCLFTSWKAMQSAAEAMRQRIPWTVLSQSDLPKPKLVEKFAADEHSCLFATMGFWQGVDVPGPSLSLVTIDRLPFPRPDDPLLRARRDAVGAAAFEVIDVPRAATLLAQGAGRLVRSRSDRGVVAVLDPRLGKARYRWQLVRALPPMKRTRARAEVEAFLASLRANGSR
jgi:ATP-dependent DNA helicase DinG